MCILRLGDRLASRRLVRSLRRAPIRIAGRMNNPAHVGSNPLASKRTRLHSVHIACGLVLWLWADSAAAHDLLPSPLVDAGPMDSGRGARLVVDAAMVDPLRDLDRVYLVDFVMPDGGRVDLDLSRLDVFTPDARIVAVSAQGERELPLPDVVLLAGSIAGDPDSTVFLSFGHEAVYGVIESAAGRALLSSGPYGESDGTAVIYDPARLAPGDIIWREFRCGTEELYPGGLWLPASGEVAAQGGGGERARGTCRAISMAIETDSEFTANLFGGNPNAAASYAATLVGQVSTVYLRDVQTYLRIGYLRLWETANDPWTVGDMGGQLDQFRSYWIANMSSVQRNLAHFVSGRCLGGGVAWVGQVCSNNYGYALSSCLGGYFPTPLRDNDPQNWDPFVFAHETGHNCGSWHTHDLTPPADGCGLGDCSVAPHGTIMSYCHGCPGGMINIEMRFHERNINENILPHLEYRPCDLYYEPVQITEFPAGLVGACLGYSVTLEVVAAGEGTLTYAWYKDYVPIPGADEPSLTIDPFEVSDIGNYFVVVSNPCGSVTSPIASVMPADDEPATIEQQPEDAFGCFGDTITFSVVAGGTGPFTYQWRWATFDIPGATGPTYTIESMDQSDIGYYSVVVTNRCHSVASRSALLLPHDPVPGDLNDDQQVDAADLSQLLAHFGQLDGAVYTDGDLDGDGDVDLNDLSVLLLHFGQECY